VWHAAQNVEAFSRQIAWREFAHHLLFHFPQTQNQPLRQEFSRFPWEMNAAHFSRWTKGCTGYPLVDAGMRELWRTGWMHNRVRMGNGLANEKSQSMTGSSSSTHILATREFKLGWGLLR
jgi:deoxyribodipyrimidine photo-lyase